MCIYLYINVLIGIDGNLVKRFVPNWSVRYGTAYSVIMFIMWTMTILGLNELIVAYSISIWFFSK